jgi:hypothetical protein
MNSLSHIPEFHEKRITLGDIRTQILETVGGPEVIDIGQTIRVLLADYFYGEDLDTPGYSTYTINDRKLVFAQGVTLPNINVVDAIDMLGDVFWSLEALISMRVLQLTPEYTYKPSECLYKFFPDTLELVVYTPVLAGFIYPPQFVALSGIAVMTTCRDFLPSFLRDKVIQA